MFVKTFRETDGEATKCYIEPDFKYLVNNDHKKVAVMVGEVKPSEGTTVTVRDGLNLIVVVLTGKMECKVHYPTYCGKYATRSFSPMTSPSYEDRTMSNPWCIVEIIGHGFFIVWSDHTNANAQYDIISKVDAFALLGEDT